jgi:hypothetical protein
MAMSDLVPYAIVMCISMHIRKYYACQVPVLQAKIGHEIRDTVALLEGFQRDCWVAKGALVRLHDQLDDILGYA